MKSRIKDFTDIEINKFNLRGNIPVYLYWNMITGYREVLLDKELIIAHDPQKKENCWINPDTKKIMDVIETMVYF